jgi:succinate-semialdehyde dehydrogenase / glutarate-semialdehyde dehydrogenase
VQSFIEALIPSSALAETGLVVVNPATLAVLAHVYDYSTEEVEDIIAKADRARSQWSDLTAKERCRVLMVWRDLVMDHQEQLAQLMTAECGKPVAESMGEVLYGASFIEWFAEEGKRVYGDIIPSHSQGKQALVLKQPIGTTAAITPWNFPLAMITRKAAPALAAGCSMVVKPAEATPLTALALEYLAHQAGIPRDIFRVVTTTRPAEIGSVLCASPIVRKLSFTGSTAVGRTLMRQSSDTVKKLSLELGGNAPFIVFDDADIDAAVEGAIVSKYRNAGQTCVCVNRFLVQENIAVDFLAKLTARVRAMVVGKGTDEGVAIGPLINAAALDKVERLVGDAVSNGAKLCTGGHRVTASDGYFYAPTVITGVTRDMALFREEIFGPVAAIITFKDEAEAIALANDTEYGLAAYFYTQNLGRSWRVMQQLEYGMVGVNEGLISTEVAPFGGIKQSGLGREGSKYGIDEYIEMKYCLVGGLVGSAH